MTRLGMRIPKRFLTFLKEEVKFPLPSSGTSSAGLIRFSLGDADFGLPASVSIYLRCE